jgi:hypothetical protein
MALGFGSIKQMSDTFRYNRNLLGKRKSPREIYREEIKRSSGNYEIQRLDDVRVRVAARLKRNRVHEVVARTLSILILLAFITVTIWAVPKINFKWKKPNKYADKSKLFRIIIYKESDGSALRTHYFPHGPKAAETLLKSGLKHQNSESYYETGQQFRSALYYYDTLIRDIYFFKTGDTIKNFPTITDSEVHHITLFDKAELKKIEFDFWEGKVVSGTYKETVAPE